MTVKLLSRQRVQRGQRWPVITGLRNQPGQWSTRSRRSIGVECARDGERLLVACTGEFQRRPCFADRVRPDRRESIRQRGVGVNLICGNIIRAPGEDPTPGFLGGPCVQCWDVVGLGDGGCPAALAEVVGETARCDRGRSSAAAAATATAAAPTQTAGIRPATNADPLA